MATMVMAQDWSKRRICEVEQEDDEENTCAGTTVGNAVAAAMALKAKGRKRRKSKRNAAGADFDVLLERLAKIDSAYKTDAKKLLEKGGQVRKLMKKVVTSENFLGWRLDLGLSWRNLEAAERRVLLDVTEENMEDYYGTQVWKKEKGVKRRDMAHRDARYIIMRDEQGCIGGFCNYRFVIEDEWVVLYVYELQVVASHRRKGLGKALLKLSELLASETGMEGVMLTALKCNEGASRFYARENYFPSTIDPTRMFPEQSYKFNYRILQKFLPKSH